MIRHSPKWTPQFCATKTQLTRFPCIKLVICMLSRAKWLTSTARQQGTAFPSRELTSLFALFWEITGPRIHMRTLPIHSSSRNRCYQIRKGSVEPVSSANHAAQSKPFVRRNWNTSTANVDKSESPPSPTRITRCNSFSRRSKSPPMMAVSTTPSTSTGTKMPSSLRPRHFRCYSAMPAKSSLNSRIERWPVRSSSANHLPTELQFVLTTPTNRATDRKDYLASINALPTAAAGVLAITDIFCRLRVKTSNFCSPSVALSLWRKLEFE